MYIYGNESYVLLNIFLMIQDETIGEAFVRKGGRNLTCVRDRLGRLLGRGLYSDVYRMFDTPFKRIDSLLYYNHKVFWGALAVTNCNFPSFSGTIHSIKISACQLHQSTVSYWLLHH